VISLSLFVRHSRLNSGRRIVWLADLASPTPMTLAMMRETSAQLFHREL
jgi:hypothetical protein